MTTKAIRITAVGTGCALAGAGAGIAGSTAATSSKSSSSTSSTATSAGAAAKRAARPRRGGPGFGPKGAMGRGRPVHSEQVVLNKAGEKYITQTVDNGVVKSTSGTDLVLTEGTTAVHGPQGTTTTP